jgi:hypothetical protein
MTANHHPGPWVEAWLSPPRFGAYVAAAGADRQLALDPYEWNAVVSSAFQHDLAHLEVALRNTYDAAIVANTVADLPHWTTDPYRLFPVRWRAARDGTTSTPTAPRASRSSEPSARLVRAHRPARSSPS